MGVRDGITPKIYRFTFTFLKIIYNDGSEKLTDLTFPPLFIKMSGANTVVLLSNVLTKLVLWLCYIMVLILWICSTKTAPCPLSVVLSA